MPNLLTDARLPRYHRLRDELAARIAALEWRPGDPLPTEQALADTYGVAVGTVRKAIDLLEREGQLTRQQGRGTFVRRASFDQSLFRFFRFQSADGVRRAPRSEIVSRTAAPADAPLAARLGVTPGAPILHLRRIRHVDGAPRLAEHICLPLPAFEALLELPLDAFGDLLYPLYETRCARVVARATETLTVETATAEDVARLALAPRAAVVVIARTAYGHDGQVLEWRLSRGAAQHFAYQIDIH